MTAGSLGLLSQTTTRLSASDHHWGGEVGAAFGPLHRSAVICLGRDTDVEPRTTISRPVDRWEIKGIEKRKDKKVKERNCNGKAEKDTKVKETANSNSCYGTRLIPWLLNRTPVCLLAVTRLASSGQV